MHQKSKPNKSRLAGTALLVVVIGGVCVLALVRSGDAVANRQKPPNDDLALSERKVSPPREQEFTGKNEFGQFPPCTEAERELEKMLHGKDEDIDLALANWLVAADVPQFRDMTRETYLKQLDEMTQQVSENMVKMSAVARSRGQNPRDPNTRCAIFCNAILKLRFAYTEEFRQVDPKPGQEREELSPAQMRALHSDANNTFFVGLMRTRRGSCVSMPLSYLVIGQRLGMPVYLVLLGKHFFIRWEEPGYLMNIETTVVEKVTVTPHDSVYLEIEGMTADQLTGNQMRNLTRREVVGNLFYERSVYWATKGGERKTQQCLDLSWARHLAPDDPGIKATHEGIFQLYGIKPEHTGIDIRITSKK